MLELFAGEQSDEPDLEALARQWRDHGLHLVPRGGGAPLPYSSGEFAGDPDAPVFDLLRLANVGRMFLRASAAEPDRTLGDLRETAKGGDLLFVDAMRGLT